MARSKPKTSGYTAAQREIWSRKHRDYRGGSLRDGTAAVLMLVDGVTMLVPLSSVRDDGTVANPKRGKMARGKRGKRNPKRARAGRARNTHDPSKSTRRFKSAVEAADRELTAAVEAAEKNRLGLAITRLVHAAYWAGQARAEEDYRGQMDMEEWKRLAMRLKEIEQGMGKWGKNVEDWMGEAS